MMAVEEFHSPDVEMQSAPDLNTNPSNNFGSGTISIIYNCKTDNASSICIFDIAAKLKQSGYYHIGASYGNNNEPEFWFFFTASKCHGNNYLLNLFLTYEKTGYFSIGLSDSTNHITHKRNITIISNESLLSTNLTWRSFRTSQKKETIYLKTYNFSQDDVKKLENRTLIISFSLQLNPKFTLNNDLVKRIKLEHDSVGLLSKQEKTDFILKSTSGKEYQTHKIILVALSSVLRNLVKNSKSNTLFIDLNDDDMTLLLEFIYSGTISDIKKYDSFKILEIADKLGIDQLFSLLESIIIDQIKVDNAVQMAVLAKKFKLSTMLSKIFNFIQNNADVLMSEGWKHLDDVELAKTLFHLHMKKHCGDASQ